MTSIRKKKHISSFQIIILGFLGLVLLGSLFLMLPISSAEGQWTSFKDAAFTATSAVCVTGLIVKDTATYWSMFGQMVIITLIQIGGVGVVTVSLCVVMLSGKKIGLMQRSTMQESISAPQVGGIVKLTRFILKGMFLIEGVGAICLYPVFMKEFGWMKGIWYSIFHSISSFCNAGFDLMGVKSPFSSLTSYVGHAWINLVFCLLIIIGGIGFLVWHDVLNHKWHFHKYRMQSKVALLTSIVLIVLPAVYFYFGEFQSSVWSDLSGSEKIWASIFQSVTTRTAGMNTVDFNAMTDSGKLISIFLMLIGGSPGSTAGGMKTTTLMVLIFSAIAVFKRQEEAQCFGRRIDNDVVRNAAAILMMYLTLFMTGSVIISAIEGIPILTCMFECASAVGTVGLTLGITTELSVVSHILLMCMMFIGRVGGMTLVFAIMPGDKNKNAKYPLEKITVG